MQSSHNQDFKIKFFYSNTEQQQNVKETIDEFNLSDNESIF